MSIIKKSMNTNMYIIPILNLTVQYKLMFLDFCCGLMLMSILFFWWSLYIQAGCIAEFFIVSSKVKLLSCRSSYTYALFDVASQEEVEHNSPSIIYLSIWLPNVYCSLHEWCTIKNCKSHRIFFVLFKDYLMMLSVDLNV